MKEYGAYQRKEKLKISVLNDVAVPEHFHQDVELLYILEGTMDVMVGEKKTYLKQSDILVINANKRHSYHGTEDTLFVILSIEYQLFSDIFQSDDIIFWCDSTRDSSDKFDDLRKTLNRLLNHYLSVRGGVANLGHIALCYQVMDLLSVNFLVRTSDKESRTEQDRFEDRILQINNYIRAHYNQPISLKELSEKLFLSNGYLSRFFKKNYGMSFAEYLTNIRLYHAYDELVYSDNAITRIAYDNGFTSVTLFNKAFKKVYGDTPSAVRKKVSTAKQKTKQELPSAEIESRLEHFLRGEGIDKKAEPQKGNWSAAHSVNESCGMGQVWRQTINVGSAEDLLRSEVREHVLLLKEALGFQYVRFWNIFSSQMLIDITAAGKDYNFTRLDSILDFLLLQGLRPHLELGQKPKRIQRNVQHALVYELSPVQFQTLEQWEQVMDSLMRHLQRRYGREELAFWKMEIWYDERFSWEHDQMEHYYDLFNRTGAIVRKYSDMEIGGCGLRLGYGTESLRYFLQQWKLQPFQPDFISATNFAYIKGEEDEDLYSKRSTDEAHLKHGIDLLKDELKAAGMEHKKLYITEWNLSISDRNYINDTCFKGAYIIKNTMDVFHVVDGLAYFVGSDRASEYFDSSALLHGGTGLITKDGILKPAGFAFEFLNRLYPYFVGKGENYLITTDHHHTYGIICHNKNDLNYNYYFTSEDQLDKKQTWKYFQDRDALQLNLELTGLADGVYQVKMYRINEHYGSVLNIWSEMDFDGELTRNDIKYFRRVCEPKLTIHKETIVDGKVNLEILMEANEIAYIRLSKMI